MKKLLLILLCLPFIGFGQNVNIPDANFKAYLISPFSGVNTNGDSEIQVSEATAFNGEMICPNQNISDLTGIEAFTALTRLNCSQNPLSSLDVSSNTNLAILDCRWNQLSTLDVSSNTFLYSFVCDNNNLTSLDVSSNTNLASLSCNHNQLTSLDLSNNLFMIGLFCQYNQLTSLDVRNGNSTNFSSFNCKNNPNLNCIDVDNAAWSTANWNVPGHIDTQHYFSNNCSGTTSIQEQVLNKEILKVTDLLGREAKGTKNEVLFYIYDDGTVEKRIVIE